MSRRFGVRFEAPAHGPTPGEMAARFASPPGLYVHVPFCRTICPFCPYDKVPYRAAAAAAYLARLVREVGTYLGATPGPFPSLYVGGGTPTLCLDALAPLVATLPVTGERAIEVLPAHLTRGGADRIRDAGFGFVSVGVQSFDEAVLRRLRRPGSPDVNRRAVEAAIDTFECVDVDLIFDAAYDDPQVLLDDLRTCFRFGVDQVSTYPLMRFGYTPFGAGQHARHAEHALLRQATDLAGAHGYERRSVWTFNRVDAPTYTSITRPYFLGMGAGASFTGSSFTVNHFGIEQYGAAVDAMDRTGELPIARVADLPVPAAAAYRAFWQAYTGTLPLRSDDPLLAHPVARLLRDATRVLGWSARTNDRCTLTPAGYDRYHDLERWVTYHLIEPLWAELMQETIPGEHQRVDTLTS